jgi:TctA family transporter
MLCAVGNYSVNNSSTEIYLTAAMGILGYILIKLRCEPAPMVMGFVMGPMMEENLRRSMLLSQGDPMVFITRPISLGFILATVFLIILMTIVPVIRKRRQKDDAASTGKT